METKYTVPSVAPFVPINFEEAQLLRWTPSAARLDNGELSHSIIIVMVVVDESHSETHAPQKDRFSGVVMYYEGTGDWKPGDLYGGWKKSDFSRVQMGSKVTIEE